MPGVPGGYNAEIADEKYFFSVLRYLDVILGPTLENVAVLWENLS